MGGLRLGVYQDKILPIAYGVPLALFVWLRHRGLLWLTVAAFTVVSAAKFFWVLPSRAPGEFSLAFRVFDFVLLQIDLLLIGAVVHALIDLRARMETHNA